MPSLAYLSSSGRVSHEKNVSMLVAAFKELVSPSSSLSPSCRLVIVGDGPARPELESTCKGLDILYSGHREGEDLAEHFASADIFAFPSASETFGQVVLEAMASGLPVVALQAEGVCDIVQKHKTGGSPPSRNRITFHSESQLSHTSAASRAFARFEQASWCRDFD